MCGTRGGGHVGEGSRWDMIPCILSSVSAGETAGSSGALRCKVVLKVFHSFRVIGVLNLNKTEVLMEKSYIISKQYGFFFNINYYCLVYTHIIVI